MFDDIIKAAKEDASSAGDMPEVPTAEEIKPVHEGGESVRIAVIGVGGAGCNCVDRLTRNNIKSARTVGINTDAKHLSMTQSHKKVLIGKVITKGLGAGGDPHIAKKAAEVDRDLLKKEIGENELVFIVAGMGGGTGGGAAPIVAQLAKEQGAIVVAMVTYPFALERVRIKKAQQSIQELIKVCDTVIVIDNNRLASYVPNLPIDKAFELADSITIRAVTGIADTIMFPSLINVDYADIKTVMENGGLAMISLGEGGGIERVESVVKDTLQHPLLDVDYEGAKAALVHIEGGADMTLGDAIKVGEGITESFDSSASIKLGARVNPNLNERIRVTAIIIGVKSPYILKKDDSSTYGLEMTTASSEDKLQYL